jgi:hypothetical protein
MNIDFREPNEADLPQLSRWIREDSCPQHNDVAPEFWLPEVDKNGNRTVGTKCITVTADGEPVFYLKLENVMRCYIQFPPDADRDKLTTAIALKKAFLTVAAGAKANGYREMIFETKSDGLANFFSKFKFEPVEENYKVRL